jgi:hypothetical protein
MYFSSRVLTLLPMSYALKSWITCIKFSKEMSLVACHSETPLLLKHISIHLCRLSKKCMKEGKIGKCIFLFSCFVLEIFAGIRYNRVLALNLYVYICPTKLEWVGKVQSVYMEPKLYFVALGGLVVSVLATEPKVCGFNPGRGRWIFKGDKNP